MLLLKKSLFSVFILLAFVFGNAQDNAQLYRDGFRPAANNYNDYLPFLKGKNVGLLTNQSGRVVIEEIVLGKNGAKDEVKFSEEHLVDFLIKHKVNLKKIYAPEHGFRGTADAGELVKDGKDTKTGLPIISLYGNDKKPTKEQLTGIDIMVFDLQDVGARFYTYISSLHYLMEACAENDIPLIVLDRPNPNGTIIDGPILEMKNQSFVGMHPIPVLHGMTIGEYAMMINGEGWLKDKLQCELIVIESRAYKHDLDYSLPIAPSPNLPNDKSINLYASLCFFEGTNVSVGRGTDKQFQIFGSPFLENMNFEFTPKPNLGAKSPMHNGKKCFGRDLSDIKDVNRLELKWLIEAYQNTPDKTKFFNNFFIKLAGTQELQNQIEAGLTENQIRKTWEVGLENFKKTRAKYLIYK